MNAPYRFETIKDAGDGHPSIKLVMVTHDEWLAAQAEIERLRAELSFANDCLTKAVGYLAPAAPTGGEG